MGLPKVLLDADGIGGFLRKSMLDPEVTLKRPTSGVGALKLVDMDGTASVWVIMSL